VNANGSYSYNPNGVFNALAVGATALDSFSYTASDGNGGSPSTTVTITITSDNDAPNPLAHVGTTNQVTLLNVAAAEALGTAPDPDMVCVLWRASFNALARTAGTTLSPYTTLFRSVNANGSYSYNPNGVFNALAVGATALDSFSYTASDGNGGSASTTVTITITEGNDAPTAVADVGTTNEDTSLKAAAAGVIGHDTYPAPVTWMGVAVFNGLAANVVYPLSLHDALPI